MASYTATGSEPSSPSPTDDCIDNDLQPFYVLHKASPRRAEKEFNSEKSRKKVKLSQPLHQSPEKSAALPPAEDAELFYEELRLQACSVAWSEIEGAVTSSLRQINLNVFEEVRRWVFDSFGKIKSTGSHSASRSLCPYPLVTDGICRQIFSAFILNKNMEYVDNAATFLELSTHLKSNGCHIANLSSLDFTTKHGIAGCIRSLLRQLIMVSLDSYDVAALASWYCEEENFDKPVVVVIDDMEQCSGPLLAEFILMLSEWIIKIPIILVLGVATTIDVPKELLPVAALRYLNSFQFTLASPSERLNAIVEALLAKPCLGFTIGYEVALFLKNYFQRHDGTITSLIRALKIACTKHYSAEPLSFLGHFLHVEQRENAWAQICEALSVSRLSYAFDLPSCQRDNFFERSSSNLVQGLSDFQIKWRGWTSVLMCLFEVGKLSKMPLLEILCEAVDPTLCDVWASNSSLPSLFAGQKECHGRSSNYVKGRIIEQAIQKLREFSPASLSSLLESWAKHVEDIHEIHDKVQELQLLLRSMDNEDTLHRKLLTQSLNVGGELSKLNEKAAILMKDMVRDYLKPIECVPFHEIFCFKRVGDLRSALIGDPRRRIHLDLIKSPCYIQCLCCRNGNNALTSSMHDTSIMYHLAQEHGDFINLHDWYQSFKMIIMPGKVAGRKTEKASKLTKADTTSSSDTSEASIQARFCRAFTELQITGLLRMPGKRRPDYVQRLCLGL